MLLNTVEAGEGPPLVLLHGLFGAARNWGAIQKRLAASGHRVLAMDLRNHGVSPSAPGMTYAAMADDVAETLAARGAAPARVVGHSMGGKVAMALALRHGAAMVSRLVVADIAPRRYAPKLRAHVAAMRALPLREGLTRKEADAALAPSVSDAGVRGFLLQSLDLSGETPRWQLGLEHIANGMGDIEGFEAEQGRRHEGPTLVLAGARSEYVTPDDRPLFLRHFPQARFAEIPDAGHWLHADNPAAFTAAVQEFCAP